ELHASAAGLDVGSGSGSGSGSESGAPAATGTGVGALEHERRGTPRQRGIHLPRQTMLRHLAVMVAGGAVLYLVTSQLSQYNDVLAGEIGAYVVALAGLSLLTGTSGQISLGHGAFMAVGAYTLALLMTHTGLNLVLELLAATGAAATVGLLVGIPATRLRGPYLAGMTLLVALALPSVADKWSNTFGGDQGLATTPPTAPGSVNPEEWLAWIELAGALVTLVLLANLLQSRFGRSFRAVRDNEVAASLSGVHVARTKVTAFAVSAACAGLGGAFLALSTGVVSTGEFPLSLSIQLLAAMVISGAGSLMGMWWGALLLVYVPQWSTSLSNHFSLGSGTSAYLATIVFGAVLVVAMIVAPSGIQGGLRRALGYAARRRRSLPARARQRPAQAGPG
ncbi:MAG TPA: branched-chain amino acid ABC transporter permease, partial [Acidimicrobiales bacterium]|nr:branched-chain amino acid ABC transporter permease [Acidimicrobiales bacterium]